MLNEYAKIMHECECSLGMVTYQYTAPYREKNDLLSTENKNKCICLFGSPVIHSYSNQNMDSLKPGNDSATQTGGRVPNSQSKSKNTGASFHLRLIKFKILNCSNCLPKVLYEII